MVYGGKLVTDRMRLSTPRGERTREVEIKQRNPQSSLFLKKNDTDIARRQVHDAGMRRQIMN